MTRPNKIKQEHKKRICLFCNSEQIRTLRVNTKGKKTFAWVCKCE